MTIFESTSYGHQLARQRASIAAVFEAHALTAAIYDAKERGMSVRETAAALQVSKSTVYRRWQLANQPPSPLPLWGSAVAWKEAELAVWGHDPGETLDFVPFEWNEDGSLRACVTRDIEWNLDGIQRIEMIRQPFRPDTT